MICEKPLTGFFGKDRLEEQVGFSIKKAEIWRDAQSCLRVMEAVEKHQVGSSMRRTDLRPPLIKLKNLIKASGGVVMDTGPSRVILDRSPLFEKMENSGGGSLMRLGAHPVGAVLHLKHYEGLVKFGQPSGQNGHG